jgi:hypothetical protein
LLQLELLIVALIIDDNKLQRGKKRRFYEYYEEKREDFMKIMKKQKCEAISPSPCFTQGPNSKLSNVHCAHCGVVC